MLRLHHVNIGIPEDGLEEETVFLTEVLGLRAAKRGPDTPPAANWFDADNGVQVHVSKDPNHRAPERAHVAFDIGDGVPELEKRLTAHSIEYQSFEDTLGKRLFFADPAGNRWEMRESS